MPDIVTAALIRKRAELAAETDALSARCDQLRADLAHLDAASRIMCPAAEPELIRPRKPSRKGCDWFGRQELPRLILGSLSRGAEQPLPCVEIARAVMACKGLNPADHMALGRVAGMVKRCAESAARAHGGAGRERTRCEVKTCRFTPADQRVTRQADSEWPLGQVPVNEGGSPPSACLLLRYFGKPETR
jgi:hypothetical protein